MTWEILSFKGMGPIRFGMTPADVEAILGAPDRSRKGFRPGVLNEYRSTRAPIVTYRNGGVSEIQAFRDLPGVSFDDIDLFGAPGIDVLRRLEAKNGVAMISTGIVLFDRLGMTTGRLDEGVEEEHSVTAFARGLWDDKLSKFEPISFA